VPVASSSIFVAAVTGVLTVRLLHQRPDTFTAAEFERRLALQLVDVNTPADMQRKSAEVAHLTASAHSLLEQSVALTGRALRFIILLGGLNFVFIAVGIWLGRTAARANI
jgi:hypothetical protein